MIFTKTISPRVLSKWITEGKSVQLIDITEENLLKNAGIEYLWLPSSRILENLDKLSRELPVVLCCRLGEGGFFMMNILQRQYNLENVYSLESGIEELQKILDKH